MADLAAPRVFVAAAGTGGHVYPALAVGTELIERGFALHWLGTARGIESRVVPRETYRMHRLPVAGLRGTSIVRRLAVLARVMAATLTSLVLMLKFRPSAVLAMGGYVTGPVGVAAWLTRRPLVVHEQNAVPGFTNRIVGRLAARVCETTAGSFPARYDACALGNPVRREIARLHARARDGHDGGVPAVLVFGGSQGAASLNRALPIALGRIVASGARVTVTHQTGADRVSEVAAAYRDAGVDANVVPFIDDMAAAYLEADLVVARAGAGTIAEITLAGLPALLVPYPYAVDDHQTANARALVDAGAALRFADADVDGGAFVAALERLVTDPERRAAMAAASHALGRPDAARDVAAVVAEEAARG